MRTYISVEKTIKISVENKMGGYVLQLFFTITLRIFVVMYYAYFHLSTFNRSLRQRGSALVLVILLNRWQWVHLCTFARFSLSTRFSSCFCHPNYDSRRKPSSFTLRPPELKRRMPGDRFRSTLKSHEPL